MQAVAQADRSKIKKIPAKASSDAPRFLEKSNFERSDYKTQRMLNLRAQGYSNRQIAKMVGCCPQTVANRIGRQPEEITKNSFIVRDEMYQASERRREIYRANHAVSLYNQIISQLEVAEAKAYSLRKQAMDLLPTIESASEVSDVKPIRLLRAM